MKQQCQEIKSAYDCSTCYITWITYNPFWYPGYAFKIIMNAVCIVTVFSAHMLTSTTDTFGWFRFLVAISLETLGSDPEREYRTQHQVETLRYIYICRLIHWWHCMHCVSGLSCNQRRQDPECSLFYCISMLIIFLAVYRMRFPNK